MVASELHKFIRSQSLIVQLSTFYIYMSKYLIYLPQGDVEMENLQSSNNAESVPMMSEPITVQPGGTADASQPITVQQGGASDASQPIVLQPRSNGDSPSKPAANNSAAVAPVWLV